MSSKQVYLPGKIRDRLQDLMKSRKIAQAEPAAADSLQSSGWRSVRLGGSAAAGEICRSDRRVPNRSPAKRVRLGEEEQRRERALPFMQKAGQAIQSLLRRALHSVLRTCLSSLSGHPPVSATGSGGCPSNLSEQLTKEKGTLERVQG